MGLDRNTFRNISYGMYVVTSHDGEKLNGQIANVAFFAASTPPRLVISINKENYTHDLISKSKFFAVGVLEQQTPMQLIGLFGFKSGRDVDKFADVKYTIGETGCPMPAEYILSAMEAKVIEEVDEVTHTLYIGDVVSAEVIKQGEPLTYADYHLIKGGKSPKTSPSYIGEEEKNKTEEKPVEKKPQGERKDTMQKYVCDVCGYIYDPAQGDPDNGIAPGTPFEKLPDDWVCPVCGVGKDQFSPVD